MSPRERQTEPVHTLHGLISSYDALEPLLSAAEGRGRTWLLERARVLATMPIGDRTPTRTDLFDLHRAMFGTVFDWAGTPRRHDAGPGGKVWTSWSAVPVALQQFSGDLQVWIENIGDDPSVESIAQVIADAHHRLQQIHPFADTNGRTIRLFDHYFLWITFQLAGSTLASSPFIEHFPSGSDQTAYYESLRSADDFDPLPLRAYYVTRITAALEQLRAAVEEPHRG